MQAQTPRQRRSPHRSGDQATVPIRSMHDVLSDPHRRAVLHYLREFEDPADADELVRQVLAWRPDRDSSGDAPPDSERARLLNDHVRRMEAFGLIAYDPGRGTVRLAEDVSVTVAPPWEIE